MTDHNAQLLDKAFDRWWFNEGSGMVPLPGPDHEAQAHRLARTAWHNGSYVNLHHNQPPSEP